MFSSPFICMWAVATTVCIAISLTVVDGFPTYNAQCTGLGIGAIESSDEAVVMCDAVSSTPATPQSGSENTAAYAAVTGALSLLGGVRDYDLASDLIIWKWYEPSTNAGEIYWASPTDANEDGGYTPTGAFASWWPGIADRALVHGTNLSFLLTEERWFVPNISLSPCVICQQEACSTACSVEGTESHTGTWWPSCTCTCKPGWVGISCSRQFAVYPISSVTSADDLATFCAAKGGYVAQPTSLAEEDAILLSVPVNDGTDFAQPVAIGANDNDATRSYCYRDGRLDGECVTQDGTTTALYSDYGDGVPTTPATTPITVLRSFSYSTGRWSSSSPGDIMQVACQFIMCSQFCEANNTASYSGSYPNCVCNCTEGFTGSRCQTSVGAPTSKPVAASPSPAAQFFKGAATVAVAAATILLFLLSDGSIEIQVMIILLGSLCATEGDRDLTVWIKYFISPAMDWGSLWVIVCNVFVAVGFTILHFVVTLIVYAYRKSKRNQHYDEAEAFPQSRSDGLLGAAATVLFPGLSFMMGRFMYIGVACATFDMLRTERSVDVSAAILGLVYVIAMPVVEVCLLVWRIVVGYVPYTALGCEPRYGWLGWLYPTGVWGPTAEVRRFIGIIGGFRNGFRYATLYHYPLALVATIFMCALHGSIGCEYLFAIMAIILFVLGILVLVTRPWRSLVYCILTGVCLISLALFCVVEAVGAAGTQVGIESAKMAFIYIAIIASILRSIISIIIFIIEWRWARYYRRNDSTAAAVEARQPGSSSTPPNGRHAFASDLDILASPKENSGDRYLATQDGSPSGNQSFSDKEDAEMDERPPSRVDGGGRANSPPADSSSPQEAQPEARMAAPFNADADDDTPSEQVSTERGDMQAEEDAPKAAVAPAPDSTPQDDAPDQQSIEPFPFPKGDHEGPSDDTFAPAMPYEDMQPATPSDSTAHNKPSPFPKEGQDPFDDAFAPTPTPQEGLQPAPHPDNSMLVVSAMSHSSTGSRTIRHIHGDLGGSYGSGARVNFIGDDDSVGRVARMHPPPARGRGPELGRSREASMVTFATVDEDVRPRARSAPRSYSQSEMVFPIIRRGTGGARRRSMSQSGVPRFHDANSTSGRYALDLREYNSEADMSLLRSTRSATNQFGQDDFDFTKSYK